MILEGRKLRAEGGRRKVRAEGGSGKRKAYCFSVRSKIQERCVIIPPQPEVTSTSTFVTLHLYISTSYISTSLHISVDSS
jgi:hypothetical protein